MTTAIVALLLTSKWVDFSSFKVFGSVQITPPKELFPFLLIIVLGYQLVSFGWYWWDDYWGIEIQDYFGSLEKVEGHILGISQVAQSSLTSMEESPERFNAQILESQRQYVHDWKHLKDKVTRAKNLIKYRMIFLEFGVPICLFFSPFLNLMFEII